MRQPWGVGRFASIDPINGTSTIPLTLNKYIYANSNPVNGKDPTGNANLMDQSTAMFVASTLSVITSAVWGQYSWTSYLQRRNGNQFNAEQMALLSSLSAECLASNGGSGCRSRSTPILILGQDVLEHTQFVASAQGFGAHVSLHYMPKSSKNQWYKNDAACKGLTGGSTGKDCDEYPYFKTTEGYPSEPVFLSPVNSAANQAAGGQFGILVVKCGLAPGAAFGVLPDTSRPTTTVACRQ